MFPDSLLTASRISNNYDTYRLFLCEIFVYLERYLNDKLYDKSQRVKIIANPHPKISYIQAEGYAAGELKHGPIALVSDDFFELALLQDNWLFDKSLSAVHEINARGGHIIAITNSSSEIDAENVIKIDTKLEILTPIIFNIAQQLFAYYVAVAKGNDVDQPRNLAKSVTVE